ncbi:20732_t:CDS:1, partial [Racocetra persica]
FIKVENPQRYVHFWEINMKINAKNILTLKLKLKLTGLWDET